MRYAKWKIDFSDDINNGIGPEDEAKKIGLDMVGRFIEKDIFSGFIVGEIYGDSDLTELQKWSVQEITQNEYLLIAQKTEPKAALDFEGKIVYPQPKNSESEQ